ncbi:MAG: hypothetical protein IJV71_07675 [Lachnospiraceae bacterium]|nr:hypothetical protein [Lachnospiraceae bacterium]
MMKMKKIFFAFFCGLMFVVSVSAGAIIARATSTKTTTGFWASNSVRGIAYEGVMQLSMKGYDYTIMQDSPPVYFYEALKKDDIIFVSCHGAEGLFEIAPDIMLTGNMLEARNVTSNTRLVYISSCYTGKLSSTNGNMLGALMRKGVGTAVGFTRELSATTDYDGSHRFDSIFMYKFSIGYNLNDAIVAAKNQIFNETGKYWGCDSYIIYGNPYITLN